MNPILKEESLFGEIACRNRFITREQLKDCVDVQREEGKGRLLGTIMLEQGCISREELRTILEIQKRNMETPVKGPQEKKADINFGVLLVKLNYLTETQVFNGIKKQAFYARKGLFFRLGEILVNEKLLEAGQVNQILSYQKKQILECPNCGKQYNANIDDPSSQICAPCQTRLRVPEKFNIPAADGIDEVKESLLSPKIIKNRFKIIQKLGTGESSVYLAEDYLQNNLNIALKVLKVAPEDEEQVGHIRNKVEQLSSFDSPHLLKIFDFGVYTDSRTNPPKLNYFLTMEYLKGEDIFEGTRKSSVEDRFLYLIHLLKGMEYLHKKKLLHLNLKPSNIIILSKATQALKILDFNLDSSEIQVNQYSAPEIAQGEDPQVASDIFSIGCIFYQILSGRPPFSLTQLKSDEEIHAKKLELEEHQEALTPIFEKMLAWNPKKRYQSVWKLRADLERICDPALILENSALRKKGLDSIFACRHKLLNNLKNIFNRHFYAHQQNILPSLPERDESFFIQLTSEPGNGLSHLIRHFSQFTEDVGVYFFRGFCYENLQQPLEPFTQIFREIANIVQNSGSLHQIKDEVLKITTEMLKEIGYFQTLRGEFKLLEHADINKEIGKQLLNLCEIFPFMISIEDLHLADDITLSCLDSLLKLLSEQKKDVASKKELEKESLLVLTTYDLKQLPQKYNNILLRWDGEKGVLRLALESLTEKQMIQMLKAMLPSFNSHSELLKLTGKNIFYLFEFIRFFWDSPVPIFSVPESQELLTKRRLAELNSTERTCLTWMSFYRKPISQRELFFFSKLKRSEVKRALKTLENLGLIREVRWSPNCYRIRHQKHVAYFLENETNPKSYHQVIQAWIVAQTKGAILSRIEELAWHAEQLDRSKRYFDYLWLASQKCKQSSNHHRALNYLATALEIIPTLPIPEASKKRYKSKVYETTGDIYQALDHPEKALASYQNINFSSLGSDDYCGQVEHKISQAYLSNNQFGKAELLLKLSLKHLSQPAMKAHSRLLMVQIEVNKGNYAQAIEHCKEAEKLFTQEEAEDVNHKPLCQYWLSFLHYHQGQFVQALEIASECFQFAQTIQSPETMIRSLQAMIQANLALGRYDQASRQLEKALSLAEKNNLRIMQIPSYLFLGEVHLRTGHSQQAREKYRMALKLAEELDCPSYKFYSILGLTHAFTGNLETEARRYLLEELNNFPAHSSVRLQAKILMANLHLKEPEEIKERVRLIQDSLDKILQIEDHELTWKLYYQLGMAYKELKQYKEAHNCLQRGWKIIQYQWASLPTNFRQIYLKDMQRQKVQQELLKISLNSQNQDPDETASFEELPTEENS